MKKKALDALQDNLRKDFQWREWIKNTDKEKPYVDDATASVFWGTSASKGKKNASVQKT